MPQGNLSSTYSATWFVFEMQESVHGTGMERSPKRLIFIVGFARHQR